MADNELYREEIVIDVNDNNATERVRNFEQRFRRSMDRINRLAQSLGGKKIEPIMQVRDKLTSSVIKADKLIKKLDAAKASPIIAAQDRVTNVVTRVNAMIDALNRRDAKVVTEMKGPLMDELVRAKKAVADLGDAKAGPVAQLKGELFYQLSRAQSMMRNVDRMVVMPKVRVLDMATSAIRNIDNGLRRLTGRVWNISVKVAGGALDAIKNMGSSIGHAITSPLGMLGIGAGAAGAIQGGIIQPLNLASNMEQSQIAFQTMLGSAQKAKRFLADLQHFAAVTPFEFPQLQDASRKLLAFGFSAKSIIPMMTAIGNAAAGLGLGAEGIDRITLALGQMKAKAKVSGDEMMQLTEAGVPAWDILAKSMHKSTAEIMQMSQKGLIPADKAINALIAGMNERFPKMMENQSRTLQGLWSTIKDTFDMNILFKWGEGIRKAIEPRLSKLVDWINRHQDTLAKWGDQIEKIANQAAQWLIDKFSNAMNWIDRNFLSNEKFKNMSFEGKIHFIWDKIGEEFDKWYESKGKALVASWGEKIGSGLGAGLMALAGVDVSENVKVNPFVDAGATAGRAFLKGFDESFDFNKFMQTKLGKWGSIILGIYAGGKIGGLTGAAIGAGVAGTYSAAVDKKTTWEDFVMPSLLIGGLLPGGIKIGKSIVTGSKWIGNLLRSGKAVETAKATEAISTIPKIAEVAAKSNKIIYGPTGEIIKNVAESTSNVAKAASEVSKLAKVANGLDAISKPLSKIAVPIGATWSIIDIFKSNDKLKAIGREAGGWAGAFAGAKLGAAGGATLGSIIPGIGTAVGAGIGGLLGSIGGFFGGNWLGGKVVDWGRNLFGKKTVNKTAAMANIQGADMNAYLNKNVYEPFREYVNRAESWGRNLILNFMRGRDSAGMSMGGWLNNKVYGVFRTINNRARSWGRNLIVNFANGRDSAGLSFNGWLNTKVYIPFRNIVNRSRLWGRNLIINFANGRDSAGMSMAGWLNTKVYIPFRNIVVRATLWGKNMIGNFILGMQSRSGDLTAEVNMLTTRVVQQFKRNLGIASPSKVTFAIGQYLMQGLINGMSSVDIQKFTKRQMDGLISTFKGGRVSNSIVASWLTAALAITGTPLSWLPGLMRLVQAESGGNPLARNPQSVGGEHATGLLQTLPSTFAQYAIKGLGGIFNPVANAVAAIRYIKDRYGSVYNTPLFRGGKYVGYARGGILTRPHLGLVAEEGPEAVIPLSAKRRESALKLWQETGQYLGVQAYAEGGYTAPVRMATAGTGTIINLNFDLAGLVGQIVINNQEGINQSVDEIAAIIAQKIKSILQNLT